MSGDALFRVHVDPDKCQGHNRCKLTAPALFVLDAYGNAREVGDGLVPVDLVESARLARANCPEYAVSLKRDGAAPDVAA